MLERSPPSLLGAKVRLVRQLTSRVWSFADLSLGSTPPRHRHSVMQLGAAVLHRPSNFGVVVPGVYRSSFPKPEDYPFIQSLNLKTIMYACYIPPLASCQQQLTMAAQHSGRPGLSRWLPVAHCLAWHQAPCFHLQRDKEGGDPGAGHEVDPSDCLRSAEPSIAYPLQPWQGWLTP